MRSVLALHIIFVIAWFAGLFYLPRLFVYHTQSQDRSSSERFKVMEHKLFYYIMTPAGILATVFGFWFMSTRWSYFTQQSWMHAKLIMVFLLWIFHVSCGKYLVDFKHDRNRRSERFYRFFNEIPTLLLIGIIFIAVLQPSF